MRIGPHPLAWNVPVLGRRKAFVPTDLSNLGLWFDADDPATLFQDAAMTTPAVADNDPVGAWLDKSGNSRHGTQPTAGNRPLLDLSVSNGRPAPLFVNASIHHLILSNASGIITSSDNPFTIFAVFTKTTNNTIDEILSMSRSDLNTPFWILRTINTGVLSWTMRGDGNNEDTANGGTPTTAIQLFTVRSNGSQVSSWHNGTSAVSGNVVNAGAVTLNQASIGVSLPRGASAISGAFDGHICEIILYLSSLSDTNMNQVERYLSYKWNTP